jgi:hypothetical protein
MYSIHLDIQILEPVERVSVRDKAPRGMVLFSCVFTNAFWLLKNPLNLAHFLPVN